MNTLHIQVMSGQGAQPSEEEVAAIIAALSHYQVEESITEVAPAAGWVAAARLEGQGFAANRAATLSWNSIERIGRAGRGNSGITGL